jgi:hypothetical protein
MAATSTSTGASRGLNGTKRCLTLKFGRRFIEVRGEYGIGSSRLVNLVEKVNAKKIDLTRNIYLENGMCPHFLGIDTFTTNKKGGLI